MGIVIVLSLSQRLKVQRKVAEAGQLESSTKPISGSPKATAEVREAS